MFKFRKPRKNYSHICSNPNQVYELLYGDRHETAKILGDEAFIDAWLDSDKQQEITMLIRKEAVNGDVPSLKQMIWLLGIMYEDILQSNLGEKEKSQALIGQLEERISFCNQLISKGVPQHYYAMISSHRLYKILYSLKGSSNLIKARNTLNEIVQHAEAVIKMGKDHPDFDGELGFIQDAEMMISDSKKFSSFLNALGDEALSKMDGRDTH